MPRISEGINASEEHNRCARLGTGPRWGTPERRLEASHVPMPVVRQGPAPDENRKCGIQSAHQSRSTDVQRSRLLPCTATSTSSSSHAGARGMDKPRPHLLKADIRAAPDIHREWLPRRNGARALARLGFVRDAREHRRNSTAAASSPPCSKAVRMAAASASVTVNMLAAWEGRAWTAS